METTIMNKTRLIETLRFLAPLLILACCGVGCYTLYEMRLQPAVHPIETREPPIVETVQLTPVSGGFEILTHGEVVPYREIEIAAELSGRIVADHARSGKYVQKGELLVEIDPTYYDIELRRRTEELNQAEILIGENTLETENVTQLISLARENLTLQINEETRIAKLVSSNTVSESEHDTAKLGVVTAQRELREYENSLALLRQKKSSLQSSRDQATIALERVREELRRTRIHAPCDGVIVKDFTEAGNYVTAGQSLLLFEDMTKTEVKCRLQTKDLYWLWLQQSRLHAESEQPERDRYEIPHAPVKVSWTIGGRSWFWEGVLSRYETSGIDAGSRSVPVRIEIPQPRNALLMQENVYDSSPPNLSRGVFVTVSIHVEPGLALWEVPSAAIRPGDKIFLAERDRLEICDVTVVQRDKDRSVIQMPCEHFTSPSCVVSPISQPRHGMVIRVIDHSVSFGSGKPLIRCNESEIESPPPVDFSVVVGRFR